MAVHGSGIDSSVVANVARVEEQRESSSSLASKVKNFFLQALEAIRRWTSSNNRLAQGYRRKLVEGYTKSLRTTYTDRKGSRKAITLQVCPNRDRRVEFVHQEKGLVGECSGELRFQKVADLVRHLKNLRDIMRRQQESDDVIQWLSLRIEELPRMEELQRV